MELSLDLKKISAVSKQKLTDTMAAFLDSAGVSTARASFYNSKEEQEAAAKKAHEDLFNIDRGVYTLLGLFPDATDYTKQLVIENLLSNPFDGKPGVLPETIEKKAIGYYAKVMPITRLLRTLIDFKGKRINNARTRKLILSTVLNSEALEYWAVKYRPKLRSILTHAWGKGVSASITHIVNKPNFTISLFNADEQRTLKTYVDKYVTDGKSTSKVYEAISFIFGNSHKNWSLDLFKAFEEAKVDITKGAKLPLEVQQGIASIYHKGTKVNLLAQAKAADVLTTTQKKVLQATAAKQGVKLDFDPMAYNAADLYIYAFERGVTDDIKRALKAKAINGAAGFPLQFDNIGILVDTSFSMMGDKTNKNKPIAAALALRDTLMQSAKVSATVLPKSNTGDLLFPIGETELAEGLAELLEKGLDAIYIISDGYENAPAGRINEIMHLAKGIGISTPVFHFNPVMAAEASATRTLSPLVPALPVSKSASIWIPFFQLQLKEDPKEAIKLLATRASNLLTN